MIPDTAKIRIEYECHHCHGNGYYLIEPRCGICHKELQMEDENSDKLSCGHKWSTVEETLECSECEGEGKIVTYISISELKEVMFPSIPF